jgi:hypothetical protein
VDGRGYRTVSRWENLSPVLCQAKLRSEETLRGSRTQADDELRADGGNFRFQPWAAGCYFQ